MPLLVKQLDYLSRNPGELSSFIYFLRKENYTLLNFKQYLELESSPDEILSTTGKISFFFGDSLVSKNDVMSVLFRLFWLSCEVDDPAFRRAIPGNLRDRLANLGLITLDKISGRIKGQVTVVEFESKYLISDNVFYNRGNGKITDEDFNEAETDGSYPTMPMHASSVQLYRHRRSLNHFKSLLDVGCGSGVQSICGGEKYVRRVGIDLHPRSVMFSRINAYANKQDIEYIVADCLRFEAADRFDHIVFNTPDALELEALDASTGKGSLSNQDFYKRDLGPRFINERLEKLLSVTGLCQIWCVIFLPKTVPTVNAVLADTIPDFRRRFQCTVVPVENSTMSISEETIARNKIPESHPAAFPSYERLQGFIKRFNIIEVTEVIINVSLNEPQEGRG